MRVFIKIFLSTLMLCTIYANDNAISLENNTVSVKILIDTLHLKQNQKSNLLVVFTIKDGWYLYSKDNLETAPKINWKLPPGITLGEPKWSDCILKKIFAEEIKVHERSLVIAYPCIIDKNFINYANIKADISWIACNQQSCQPGNDNVSAEYVDPDTCSQYSTDVPNNSNSSFGYIGLMLLFAFIGGVILNLMPCVLPVLSLKLLSLTKNTNNHILRRNGIFFTLGVLISFWCLVGILIFLKTIGHEIGWGFQLQSPSFVICLVCIFFLLAMNLFGVFELGTSFLTLSSKVKNHGNYLASFFNGVLACIIATPCTAPFMGTALGIALTQPWFIAFAIFSSLGLGMAFPVLLISYLPSCAKCLPKPGRWMETFKQFLGFCMIGSVLWLLSVLSTQTDKATLFSTICGLFVISFGCWVLGRWATIRYSLLQRILIKLLAGIFITLGFISGIVFEYIEKSSPVEDLQWIAYDTKVLEQLKAEDKTILIDFTASWCITCQFNKKLVLNKQSTVDLLKKHNVIPMRADWTSRDGNITKALQSYGRNSVPLYVLHIGKKQPIVLPEILKESTLKEALESQKISKSQD